MRLVTVLNKCCKFKSFVFQKIEFTDCGKSIIVTIKPHMNSRPICSVCQTESPGYDKIGKRLFEFIPTWGFHVFFEYNMRRVLCSRCKKVVVKKVPWADGKNHLTLFYIKYLAD